MKKTLSFLTILILLLLGAYFILTTYFGFNLGNILKVQPTELTVYAPSSLRNALNQIKDSYESENSSIKLNITYETSYEITQDILEGKKPDLAIVASQKDLETLNEKMLIVPDTQEALAQNTMVLIAAPDSTIDDVEDLSGYRVERIAVGDPDTTSIGHYTTNVLKNMGLYGDLSYKFVDQKSVMMLVKQVEDDTVQAGIVFKSDAVGNDKIKIVYEFPQTMYAPITYTMFETATEENENHDTVKLLEEYLLSAPAQQILVDNGFSSITSVTPTTTTTPTEEVTTGTSEN